MASSINASTSGAGGVITTADNTGILNLQTASTTAVTIDTSQNVGIGGTPKSTGVSGSLEFGPSTVGLITSQFDGPYFTSNLYYSGGWKYASTGYASMYAQYQSQHKWYTAPSGSANAATSLTQAMTLDSSGNLLLNLTSQQSSGKFCINFDGATHNGQVLNDTGSASSIAYTYFLRSGTLKGYIGYTTGSNLVSYNTTSDYRLKENIIPLPNALDKVMQLKPSQYTWKENGYTTTGFIAHELQAVVPDCVSGEKDAVDAEGNPKYQGVDTSFLVATLTAAIQEQQTIINDLKARIETLENT
jgi:hypothetical protein